MFAERKCFRCDNMFVPSRPNQQVCDKEHTKSCVVCGNLFSWDKRKKTCSTVCTAALRKQNSPERACAYCGEMFKPGGYKAMYCDNQHFSDCVVCGKKFKIADIHRVSKTCSTSCASSLSHTDESKKLRVEQNMKKYGVEHTFQTDEVKEKIKQKFENNSEVDYRFGSDNFKNLIKDKYDVDNVSSLDAIKKKKVDSSLLKYGTENPAQSESVKKSIKSTVKKLYSVDHQSHSEKVRKKYSSTMFEKYGTEKPTDNNIKDYGNWVNFKDWVIIQDPKPTVSEVAEHFNVHYLTVVRRKNDEGLSAYFRIVNSKKEEKFQQFLSDNLPDVSYRHNDRKVIAPFELDFYFPEHNFAVEISPTLTHHSGDLKNEKLRNAFDSDEVKAPDYHLNKALLCEKAGIELFTIFDWMPWGKSLNMIKHKLSGSSRKIYARKAKVHFVDKYDNKNKKIAKNIKTFIDGIHVLGFDGRGSQYFTYLEFDGEIIGAAAWGKPRNLSIKNLGKKRGTDVMELTRMCFKPGVSVPGGASRLLKTFIKEYPEHLNSIITFSDYDLGFGNVYGTLGFEMIEKPSAQKNYVHPSIMKGEGENEISFRIKTTSLHFAGADRLLKNVPGYVAVGMECQHTDVYHPNGGCLPTNPEIVESYGFLPVYDCGYKKWLREISEEEQQLSKQTRESNVEYTLF